MAWFVAGGMAVMSAYSANQAAVLVIKQLVQLRLMQLEDMRWKVT